MYTDHCFAQPLRPKEIFGVIRALNPFRLTGASRDYIVAPAVGSLRMGRWFFSGVINHGWKMDHRNR